MKIRRLIALAAALLVLSASCAFADAAYTSAEYRWNDVEFNRNTGLMMVRETRNGPYCLTNAKGDRIGHCEYIYARTAEMFFRVAREEGVNVYGLIDEHGVEIVPTIYGDINVLSDRWVTAVVLEETTSESYDYQTLLSSTKRFFNIERTDVFYNGVQVGSFTRSELKSARVYGAFIWVTDRDGNVTAYDAAMTPSTYAVRYASEYDYDYKSGVVTHTGSGQTAFVPGCTLTSSDVAQDVYEIKGVFYDLQGNALFTSEHASVYSFVGSYARFRDDNDLLGLIDRAGNVVLPALYEEISSNDCYFPGGYQLVVRDGMLGFVSLSDGTERMSRFSAAAKYRAYPMFFTISDLDGSVIVVSGAVGELPEHYAEVSMCYNGSCPAFVAKRADGTIGVVGLYGETIVPFSDAYRNASDLTLSYDGSTILCSGSYHDGAHDYAVLCLTYDYDTNPPPAPAATAVPEQSAAWTCPSCGQENSGNFCSNCGERRP